VAKELQQVCDQFVADLEAGFGAAALDSVVLYGSAARDDYVPGRSDVNFLVLVRGLTPEMLRDLQKRWKSWRKERIALPFFMRPEMVTSALDSYPLEFMAMRAAYKVHHGRDPLAELFFNRDDVRLQCERELRGKILYLRSGLIDCEGKKDRMGELIRVSWPAMQAIFQGLLYLAGREPSLWGEALIASGNEAYGLDDELLRPILAIRTEKKLPERDRLEDLLIRYIKEVERLVDWVDAGGLAQ
jgi:predicted nucleotidyltransferase